MNTNKILIAALAGGVASFLLGGLVYGLLLADFASSTPELSAEVAAAVQREPMVVWSMIISNLAYGLALAIIFGRWASISTFKTGAIAGAILSFLIALSFDFNMYSLSKIITLTGALIDPFINLVLGGIIGGVVGWTLGYGNKKS